MRPSRWWATVPVLGLIAATCGPGEPPVPPPPRQPELPAAGVQAAGPDRATEEPEGPVRAAARPVAPPPSTAFPHGAHRTVSCRACHDPGPGHASHATVECTSCHQAPPSEIRLAERSEEDCLSCHHDPEPGTPCATCHGADAGGVVEVATTLELAPARSVERTLAFPHERHDGMECGTCHTSGVRFEVERSCASCHRPHHRAEADCLSCHEPALDRHDVASHLGCTGSGCHERSYLGELAAERTVCLVCHSGQRTHEQDRPCVQCHLMGSDAAPPPAMDGPGAVP